jgi:hypothetical protein
MNDFTAKGCLAAFQKKIKYNHFCEQANKLGRAPPTPQNAGKHTFQNGNNYQMHDECGRKMKIGRYMRNYHILHTCTVRGIMHPKLMSKCICITNLPQYSEIAQTVSKTISVGFLDSLAGVH